MRRALTPIIATRLIQLGCLAFFAFNKRLA